MALFVVWNMKKTIVETKKYLSTTRSSKLWYGTDRDDWLTTWNGVTFLSSEGTTKMREREIFKEKVDYLIKDTHVYNTCNIFLLITIFIYFSLEVYRSKTLEPFLVLKITICFNYLSTLYGNKSISWFLERLLLYFQFYGIIHKIEPKSIRAHFMVGC